MLNEKHTVHFCWDDVRNEQRQWVKVKVGDFALFSNVHTLHFLRRVQIISSDRWAAHSEGEPSVFKITNKKNLNSCRNPNASLVSRNSHTYLFAWLTCSGRYWHWVWSGVAKEREVRSRQKDRIRIEVPFWELQTYFFCITANICLVQMQPRERVSPKTPHTMSLKVIKP